MNVTVKTTWSKGADVDLRAALAQPMALATAAARHIQARVLQGRFATPAEPFSSTPRAGAKTAPRYYVSPAYAAAAGLGEQTRWESSQAMHRAAGMTPGVGTGEMVKHIQVRNYGSEGALIEPAGSSLGSSSTRTALTTRKEGTFEITLSDSNLLRARQVRELSRDEGGKVRYRRKPKLVRNALKAGTLFKNLNIGLLQNTDDELVAMANALAAVAALRVAKALGAKVTTLPHGGDPRLYAACFRELMK